MTAATQPRLALPVADEVHVWWLPLQRSRNEARHAVHATLRRLAASYLDEDAAAVVIAPRPGGKPEILGAADLRFSLTYADGAAALAFATARDVGIDAERVRADVDVLTVAAAHFHADDLRALRDLVPERRTDAFFRAWVRKEALVKCVGTGLALGLADVRSDAAPRVPLGDGRFATDLRVLGLDAPRGLRAALAVRGTRAPGAVVVRTAS